MSVHDLWFRNFWSAVLLMAAVVMHVNFVDGQDKVLPGSKFAPFCKTEDSILEDPIIKCRNERHDICTYVWWVYVPHCGRCGPVGTNVKQI
jgi:hypothetical protein